MPPSLVVDSWLVFPFELLSDRSDHRNDGHDQAQDLFSRATYDINEVDCGSDRLNGIWHGPHLFPPVDARHSLKNSQAAHCNPGEGT